MQKKYKLPLTEYPAKYGISLSTVKRLSLAGIDLDDHQAVQNECMRKQHVAPKFKHQSHEEAMEIEIKKVLEHHGEKFNWFFKFLMSGDLVEGCNREQTQAGNLRLGQMLLDEYGVHLVRAHAGERFDVFRHLQGFTNNPKEDE